MKCDLLHTELDDWIEAERELKAELGGRLRLEDLFNTWFERSSSDLNRLFEAGNTDTAANPYDICGEHYMEHMAECIK